MVLELEIQTYFSGVCTAVLPEVIFQFWWEQSLWGGSDSREQLLFVSMNAPLAEVAMFCDALW